MTTLGGPIDFCQKEKKKGRPIDIALTKHNIVLCVYPFWLSFVFFVGSMYILREQPKWLSRCHCFKANIKHSQGGESEM